MRSFRVFCLLGSLATASSAAVIDQIGAFANWTTEWTAIPGGNDADNGVAETLDFVGDSSSPGLYFASDASHLSFRMRVDADTFTTANGAHAVLIDIDGIGIAGIDYAFAWDSKSNDNSKHGLEMCVAGQNGPTWGVSQLSDIDGNPSLKAINDINGSGRVTDGYVRTSDGQATANFGDTTFIDFAISWSYLETYTALRNDQIWNVSLASIANATDHNAFNADVSGGASLSDSISTGWADVPGAPVPEPATTLLLALGAGAMGLLKRKPRR